MQNFLGAAAGAPGGGGPAMAQMAQWLIRPSMSDWVEKESKRYRGEEETETERKGKRLGDKQRDRDIEAKWGTPNTRLHETSI